MLNLSSHITGNSNDETSFLHGLLTNTHVSRLCKVFQNNSSANVKVSKNQWHKMGLLEGILGRHLGHC